MDPIITDRQVADISKLIHKWETLLPYLNLSNSDEVVIKRNNPNDYEYQKMQLLYMWKRRRGGEATLNYLVSACYEAGEGELAQQILHMSDNVPTHTVTEDQPITIAVGHGGRVQTDISPSVVTSPQSLSRCQSISTDQLKLLRQLIKDVLNENKEALMKICGDDGQKANVGYHMGKVGIIGAAEQLSPTCDGIITSFETGLLLKKNIPNIEDYCNRFIKGLANAGGPAKEAAGMLIEEWTSKIKKELFIELKLSYKP
jgi:hypothetical protein